MIFSSAEFYALFLPLCLIGFALVSRFGPRVAVWYLALSSVAFYAVWSRKGALLLLGSIAMNFLLARVIAASAKHERLQSLWLTFGVAANIGLLCYFKYLFPFLNFLHAHGLGSHAWGEPTLPLGISFFTFTQIAYLIDLKQGIAQPEPAGRFVLFVTFFPHLIAGPILHHREMMPQFRNRAGLRADDLALGATWFTMGFFKKSVIADRISPAADALFAHPHAMGTAASWYGVLIYSMQLYFDFSGYSDMAIGLARMFSIRFPMNFNSPFKALDIIDFWQRWHMTLTHYIMSYVYAPLQMKIRRWRQARGLNVSKRSYSTISGLSQMVLFPTLFTMFFAGVWHGAGLQFLAYGMAHGVMIACTHTWRTFVPETNILRRMLIKPVRLVLTYLCVVLAFVFFRAESLHDAWVVFAGLLGRHGSGEPVGMAALLLLAGLFAIVWSMPNTQEILGEEQRLDNANWNLVRVPRWSPTLGWWGLAAAALLLCVMSSGRAAAFLYFQF